MRHLEDDLIERYSMGKLADPELTEVEEHLLACVECQERVEAEDRFTRAARAALSRPESAAREPSQRGSMPTFAWIGVAAAVALFAYISVAHLYKQASPTQTVQLMAMRGPGDTGKARADVPVRLRLDTANLRSASYTVDVTDASGRSISKQTLTSSGSGLELQIAALPAGKYWVNLSSGSDLARQFSLVVEP